SEGEECSRPHARAALLGREAVEEAVASRALEIVLAAAAVGPARGMRRVPRLGGVVVAQPLPVVMADHRRALAALGPVGAGAILAGRERGTVRLRARQDVVRVRRVAAPVDGVALLGERGLLVDVVRAVELGEVLGDDDALGVLPGPCADAVARIDGAGALRAQIRLPGLGARARRRAEQLTELVGTREPAAIAALAGALARDEEAKLRLLRLAATAAERQKQRRRHAYRQSKSHVHSGLLVMSLRPAMSPRSSGRRTGAPRFAQAG